MIKLFSGSIIAVMCLSSTLFALEYEIQDIGTLQTHSSQAIAINNEGQILGWYNLDGTPEGKHFFVRDQDGSFHEIPKESSMVYENIPQNMYHIKIDWKYLTGAGVAYGTFSIPNANPVLYMWDQNSGIVKLGQLPGAEISAINDVGQVLIKSIQGADSSGKLIHYPIIWQNGKITKLRGLEGDLGTESNESYGFDMNNNGDVVGRSFIELVYKNNIYKESHAVLWTKGQAIDLHRTVAKSDNTIATKINDLGDIVFNCGHLVRNDGKIIGLGHVPKVTDSKYFICGDDCFTTRFGERIYCIAIVNNKLYNDYTSIWMTCNQIMDMNDNGEVIVKAKTVYGEDHAMLLIPVQSK